MLLAAVVIGVAVGPAGLSPQQIIDALAARLPWHPHVSVPPLDAAIVWQIRLPRVLLGVLVGSMLAGGGAAYQGVFRNPLADPYLLGVAAGAGLGATIVVVSGGSLALTPPAAFAGAVGRRHADVSARRPRWARRRVASDTQRYRIHPAGRHRGRGHADRVPDLPSAAAHADAVDRVLLDPRWPFRRDVVGHVDDPAVRGRRRHRLLIHRRFLDVLRVGETEATSLGVNVARLRLIVIVAATLGVAAAVAVSGLIGFVGIIVPHAVRLTAGPSYRVLLPVSMIGGAAFLVLADVAARTVQAPSEVPIGVITALTGAPFFLFVLRSRRARQDLS